ncbi:MAG TPA: FliA/WhiG family RNA polymerase sigma factor, partial [bacterium]|nr:FliA/WhiG family RNA polymerase sigma factor [bacterium]
SREACVEAWLPLVKRVWARLKVSLPPSAEHLDDDLQQCGAVGLVQALESFQPASGVPFEAWARLRIRGAMLDELRRQDWISKESRRRWKALQAAVRVLEQRLERSCTEQELAQHLGLGLEALREMLLQNAPGTAVFLDGLMPDGSQAWSERLTDPDQDGTDSLAISAELKGALARAIGRLPEQEHKLLFLLLDQDLGHKEAAAVLGVTPGRVSQIYAKAVLHLQAAMVEPVNR